jgi:hypothetical protein
MALQAEEVIHMTMSIVTQMFPAIVFTKTQ